MSSFQIRYAFIMFKYLFIFIGLFSFVAHSQNLSEVAGYWDGSIDLYGEELKINLTFSYTDEELDGTIDIPRQGSFNLPVEVTGANSDSLFFQFETGTGPAVFHGKRNRGNRTIEGNFEQMGEFFPFQLFKKNVFNGRVSDFSELELLIPTRAGQISGSLLLQEDPAPLIIMLSGTGSQDRDENTAGFRMFRVLSDKLYNTGYSTFRFDDRGIGESEGEQDATLQELADDLVDIIGYLHENHGEQFNRLILLGHNQGGLVASLAERETEISGLILLGTPFLRGDEIIKEQIILISEERNVPDEIVDMNLEFQQRIFDVVRNNSDWSEIEQDLTNRLEEQINELPDEQRATLGDMSSFIQSQVDRQLSTAKSRWFKSLIELEPAELITEVDVPIIAIFGEKDMQVSARSNSEVANRLVASVNVNLEIAEISGANHLFQSANTGMPSEYGMLENNFADEFLDVLLQWLQSMD
ncbi:MAG: alpha/beta hydrolase [Balneolaceae bacterium]|nr:alpha/beta hydrolase [Balneolaceae bacterium]